MKRDFHHHRRNSWIIQDALISRLHCGSGLMVIFLEFLGIFYESAVPICFITEVIPDYKLPRLKGWASVFKTKSSRLTTPGSL